MTTNNNQTTQDNNAHKIKVGIYTFSCCEDNTIMITVLMNKYLLEWKKRIDFVEARVLKKKKSEGPLDVAIIEGAIQTDEQAEKLKKLRERAKFVLAIGSCACTGMPAGQRNSFSDEVNSDIQLIRDRFKYSDQVRKLDDIVKVDAKVPGCPMNSKKFLEALNQVFIKFGHEPVEILEE